MAERVIVVAAVIERDGRFLIARRLEGTHLAGCWEFPGGKVHAGETMEAALRREIVEELGAGLGDIRAVYSTSHDYAERQVELHFFRASLTSDPAPLLGQDLRWARREELSQLTFPVADAELIAGLIDARF